VQALYAAENEKEEKIYNKVTELKSKDEKSS
jgi:hypothetical protein